MDDNSSQSRPASPAEDRALQRRVIENPIRQVIVEVEDRKTRYEKAQDHADSYRENYGVTVTWRRAIEALRLYDDPMLLMVHGFEFEFNYAGWPESVESALQRLWAMGLPPSQFEDSEVTKTTGPCVRVGIDIESEAWQNWKSSTVKLKTLR